MTNSPVDDVLSALQGFAREVSRNYFLARTISAQPEDQLKGPVKALLSSVGHNLGLHVEILSEAPIHDVGRPDLAVAVNGLLVGYVELKAPGEGTTQRDFSAANRDQLRRFLSIPNLIYTDARDWTFYVDGSRQSNIDLRMGAIELTGDTDITLGDADKLLQILRTFLRWEPLVPSNPKQLASLIAPITRMLRDDVSRGLNDGLPALSSIYDDWRHTLFPDATGAQFADSYAQTITYGLLLAKVDGATIRNTAEAAQALSHHSSLLARTLEILTQQGTRQELGVGLQLLERIIESVNPQALQPKIGDDPWLYFYEDFLAEYDPKLRNERGVYYTPAQVVRAQVVLVDQLLRSGMGIPDGVAGEDVTVLDPAAGTGTYLLQVLQRGVDNVSRRFGPGVVGSVASQMARNLYGFELLVGPYAVAHLRLVQSIHSLGGQEPEDGIGVYLADTLESPYESGTIHHSFFEKPLSEEHERAREVKERTKILVCIGNPPYEREVSEAGSEPRKSLGGWIRSGDKAAVGSTPLLEDFLRPARLAGLGGVLQPVYNLYVYFWRWALWKVFDTQDGPGVVSFITASSYLRGPGFAGVREEMRRVFDELWIVDLEGGSLGPRKTENVFDIRTPVAILIGIRYSSPNRDLPSAAHYTKVTGTRIEKFAILDSIESFADLTWHDVQSGWLSPLLPVSEGDFFSWPRLDTLMPWVHTGPVVARTWPIGETEEVLLKRWKEFASSKDKAALFRENADRKISVSYFNQIGDGRRMAPLDTVTAGTADPPIVRYGFRSFDRQFILADQRLIGRPRPPLWHSNSDRQIFVVTMNTGVMGTGPAAVCSTLIPDFHSFRGSFGGKHVFPLYRDPNASATNITDGLLSTLEQALATQISSEQLISYVVGIIGHRGYTSRFLDELEVPGPRIPITKNSELFLRVVDLGKAVIAWQTFAERFSASLGTTPDTVPTGKAKLIVGISDDPEQFPDSLDDVAYDAQSCELRVGVGRIANVDPSVWHYEVSGLQVVRSWLGYRVRNRAGRRSSTLDDIRPVKWTLQMSTELMKLLWVLEGLVALEPEQEALLDDVLSGPIFLAAELPIPNEAECQPPEISHVRQSSLGGDFG